MRTLRRASRFGAARGLLLAGLLALAGAAPALAQSNRPGIGATPYDDGVEQGVTFRVWAPFANTVNVAGQFNGWSTTSLPLTRDALNNEYWSRDVPAARPGDEYKFVINGNLWRKDPRGRMVTFSGGFGNNSIVVDPDAFDWQDAPVQVTPFLNELVIYQLHIGSFNDPNGAPAPPGTFFTAIDRLDHIEDMGFNAIKLLPVTEFPGDFSWGYNPSDPYAVENIAYGGVVGLKTFVREANKRNIAVLLDLVHNHYGPGDLDLYRFDGWFENGGGGIYFYQTPPLDQTPWGLRPDFGRPGVRSYISDNVRMWLDEYRVDGFRWDATRYIRTVSSNDNTDLPAGRTLLQEINGWMATEYPGRFRIAEDNSGDPFVTGGLGYQSDWRPAFHHNMMDVLAQTDDQSRNMFTVANQIIGDNLHTQRVIYLESHDEVGNLNAKQRTVQTIDSNNPGSYFARKRSTLGSGIMLTSPGIPMMFMGQEMLTPGIWADNNPLDWTLLDTYSGVVAKYRDLIRLRRNMDGLSQGLKGPNTNVFHVNNGPGDKVVAFHRWDNGGVGDDVVVVANFRNATIENYQIGLPRSGAWFTVFNSDSTFYGDDYGNIGSIVVDANGGPLHGLGQSGAVTVAPYSMLVLSQSPPSSSVGDWILYDH